MDLFIRHISKIDTLDIAIDSITVIAGYNGSGKTTASKALYAMLRCSAGNEPDSAMISDEFHHLFSDQIVSYGDDGHSSEIVLRNHEGAFALSFNQGIVSVSSYSPVGKGSSAIYLKSPSRLITANDSSDDIDACLRRPKLIESTALSESCDEFFRQYGEGEITEKSGRLYYIDDEYPGFAIDLANASSGDVILAILRRLIDNGAIKEGSILIIDEPETNLHPEKQVILARIISELSASFGIRFLLSSHNIYFIRALEVALAEKSDDKHRFYLMHRNCDTHRYSSVDVTDNMEKIYHELYSPLEDL